MNCYTHIFLAHASMDGSSGGGTGNVHFGVESPHSFQGTFELIPKHHQLEYALKFVGEIQRQNVHFRFRHRMSRPYSHELKNIKNIWFKKMN